MGLSKDWIVKEENKHDFSGDCAPGSHGNYSSQSTFSVGIFKWIPKSTGKGLKKTKVICRVKGSVNMPESVYNMAAGLCKGFDDGLLPTKRIYNAN